MKSRLYYIHDPMCSWCWAFRPVWERLQRQLEGKLEVRYLLGGLAPDSDLPMPQSMQDFLRQTWQTIQQRVPGTPFNFDFWRECQPRRSTYPACRAVIAAREQGAEFEQQMILAIQQAYYLQARNPSDQATLIGLADAIGLDTPRFSRLLDAAATRQQLAQEIALSRRMGADSFPSLVLQQAGEFHPLQLDYLQPAVTIQQLVAAGAVSTAS